jgi:hypothetical protein
MNVAVIMNSIETYALMARCLNGEGSPEENRYLSEMLFSDPLLLKDFQLLKQNILSTSSTIDDDKSIYTEEHLQIKFDSLTKKLKDEGAL